jgi:hypothetical protein
MNENNKKPLILSDLRTPEPIWIFHDADEEISGKQVEFRD